ncbi:MAG: cation-translocating P-type ATPase, partial [Candidatus Nealsonbacteria bacterium]|nr:cation-translocating P-type ATPase [Candidatus Nealsonbacteria bacterium]
EGHVYQGRFKSFPVQDDDHFCVVCRYVERNALRAGLVDARYKRSSTAVLRNLAALLPSKARAPDGRFLAAATFAVGDRVRVEKDETVPLDGRLLHGEAWVSEACLTGESRPVHKAPADRLFAGSTLTAGSAELELTATSQGSTLARVLDQVQQAMLRPHRWSRLANRIAAGFFPVVIALRQPNDTPQLRGAPDAREKTVRHIA